MAAACGEPPLTMHARWRAGTVIVALGGELDICAEPDLTRLLAGVLAQRPKRLVLDLAAVTFIDCAAAGALVAATRDLPESGKAVISRMSGPADRLIRLTDLRRYFEIADAHPEHQVPRQGTATRAGSSPAWPGTRPRPPPDRSAGPCDSGPRG